MKFRDLMELESLDLDEINEEKQESRVIPTNTNLTRLANQLLEEVGTFVQKEEEMGEAEYALKRLHGIFQKHRIQVNSLVTYTELTKVGAFQPEVESEDSTALISENIKEIIENHISFWDEDALLVLRETLMYFESL
ncbi:hypothetical protein [Flexithrix dorotheae]|uniref:hypothetical protein n=1 Tax=Flexithrix dorotheae TaxID=70993 RepID=UPI00038013B5|nr:hypothetical protein [Flexithrix dorotheae]